MNNRLIDRIARHAGLGKGLTSKPYEVFDHVKFAQLIIAECVDACNTSSPSALIPMNGTSLAESTIRKRFDLTEPLQVAPQVDFLDKLRTHLGASRRYGYPVPSSWGRMLLDRYSALPGAIAYDDGIAVDTSIPFGGQTLAEQIKRIAHLVDQAERGADVRIPSPWIVVLLAEHDRLTQV